MPAPPIAAKPIHQYTECIFRETILQSTAPALHAWFQADHEARLHEYRERAVTLQRLLGSLPGIATALRCFTLDERLTDDAVNCLVLSFGAGAKITAAGLCAALAAGSPEIAAVQEAAQMLLVTETLEAAHLGVIAERVRAAVMAAG